MTRGDVRNISELSSAAARHRAYEAERRQWEAIKAAFVTAAHRALMDAYTRDGDYSPWYAYVKPSAAGTWGELLPVKEADDPPAGFELVSAERIPPFAPHEIARWFERLSGRLPVYPL